MNIHYRAILLGLCCTLLLSSCLDQKPTPSESTDTPALVTNQTPSMSVEQKGGRFVVTATDPDSASLVYEWKLDGEILSSDTEFDPAEFSDIYGEQEIVLTVSDGQNEITQIIEMSFAEEVNRAPTVIVNKVEGIYVAQGSDVDGDELTYSWMFEGTEISTESSLDISTLQLDVYEDQVLLLSISDGQLTTDLSLVVNFGIEIIDLSNLVLSADVLSGETPFNVNFTLASAIGESVRSDELVFDWDLDGDGVFGDSTLFDPSNTFLEQGEFQVSVNISQENAPTNTQTLQLPIEVLKGNSAPVVTVSEVMDGVYSISASDEDGDLLSYAWKVASTNELLSSDMLLDTQSLIVDFYGEQTVEATVFDGKESTLIALVIDFGPRNEAPSANFTVSAITGEAPFRVEFDSSLSSDDNGIIKYNWRFGDGESSDLANPIHVYQTAGDYTISYYVEDAHGESSYLVQVEIQVTEPVQNLPPNSYFTQRGFVYTADSTDDGTDLTYQWFLNDVLIGTQSSIEIEPQNKSYLMELVTTDSEGLSDTYSVATDYEDEQPSANLGASITVGEAPLTILFNSDRSTDDIGIVAHNWNFGDGNIDSLANPKHVYTDPGTYEVSFYVVDSSGQRSDTVSIEITVTAPNQAPVANITTSVSEGDAPLSVTFDAYESTDDHNVYAYYWLINDISYTTDVVSTSFDQPGEYEVLLRVYDIKGLTSVTTTSIIVHEPKYPPVVEFSVEQTNDVSALTVHFESSGTYDENPEDTLNYVWDFGDGQFSVLSSDSHTYANTGEYTVQLTVHDGEHFVVAQKTIAVLAPNYPPTANYTMDINRSTITLDASSSSDPEFDVLDYNWTFYDANDQVLDTSNGATVTYTFADIGMKSIQLMVSDGVNSPESVNRAFEIYQYTSNGGAVFFAENYESQVIDQSPDGWGMSTEYVVYSDPTYAQQTPNVSVTTDVVHSGSNALFIGSGNYVTPTYTYKTLDFSSVDNVEKLYVRYYVYSDSTFLGNRPVDDGYEPNANANHFMALAKQGDFSDEIRIGEFRGALGVLDYYPGGTVPGVDYWYGDIETPRMQAQTWYCMETAFINDGESSQLMTWLDGELITQIDDQSDFHIPPGDNKWLDGMFEEIRFGWGSNHSFANEMYFDDIIASNERIGCDEVIVPVGAITETHTETFTDTSSDTETLTETDTDTQTDVEITDPDNLIVDQAVIDAAISATLEDGEVSDGNIVYTPNENGAPSQSLPAPVLVTLDTQGNAVEYTLPYPQSINYGVYNGYFLDDFNDNDTQNNVGAALSTLHCQDRSQGGGDWSVYAWGDSSITNDSGLPIFKHNLNDAIQDYSLHLYFDGVSDSDSAGVGTYIAFEDYAVSLEGLTSIEIRVKGSGDFTPMFEPSIANRPVGNTGNYAAEPIPLSSSMRTFTIPVGSFVGQESTDLDGATLNVDREAIAFYLQAPSGDSEIYLDSIKFIGSMSIADIQYNDSDALSVADCGLLAALESGAYTQDSYGPITQPYLDFTDIQIPVPSAPATEEGITPATGSTGINNWLNMTGTKLYDSNNIQVRLTGVNWFGFESNDFIPFGLWDRSEQGRSYIEILDHIKSLGFNTVQLPFSDEMIMRSRGEKGAALTFGSDELLGKIDLLANNVILENTPLDLMDNIIEYAQDIGLKIILNSHSRQADSYMEEGYWINPDYDFSMDDWIENWRFIADRYHDNDAVIALNLNNEPHFEAHWADFSSNTNWNEVAQTLASEILDVNENVLIIIEGVEYTTSQYSNLTQYWWGSNLQGVRNNPIDLGSQAQNAKLVYGFHEYGPEAYVQSWFKDSNFPRNLKYLWEDRFGFINTTGEGHLLVSDFGINKNEPESVTNAWFEAFISYIGQRKGGYSWMYASWNSKENRLTQSDLNSIESWKLNLLNGKDSQGLDIDTQPSLFAPLIGNQNGQ